MAEATRKFAALKSELDSSMEPHMTEKRLFGGLIGQKKDQTTTYKERVPARKMQDLKLAFSEYYLSLVLIQNYQNLNFTGKKLKNRQSSNGKN